MKKRVLGVVIMIAIICSMLPLHVLADTVSENSLIEKTDDETVSGNEIEYEEEISLEEGSDEDGEQTVSENDIVEEDEETSEGEEETSSEEEESTLEYNEAVLAEKNTLQNYYVYKSQLNAQRLELKSEYLESVKEEWAQRLLIEKKKLEMGYSTQAIVDEIQCQYDSVQLQMDESNALQTYYVECITIYEGQEEEIIVPQEWTALSEDYVDKFKADSTQMISYEEQIKENKELLEFVGEETEYGKEIAKQLQLAELNLKQYEMNLEVYVKTIAIAASEYR